MKSELESVEAEYFSFVKDRMILPALKSYLEMSSQPFLKIKSVCEVLRVIESS